METPIISVKGVSKSFPNKGSRATKGPRSYVLGGVSLELKRGSFTSIIGPSGCGKTTLLRVIDGLTPPDSGEVLFDGRPVTGPPPKIGFVFQQYELLPWRTILKNVEFGLELRGVDPSTRVKTAEEYIGLVGLKGFGGHLVHEVSAGMRQRAGLARALAINPDVLLMDEPFASVDEQTRATLQKELLQIVKGTAPKTTLFVTHNVDEAIVLSDEIVLLGGRPARVKEVIRVDLPGERWSEEVRFEPQYRGLWQRIWRFLESEMMERGGFGSSGN